MPEFIDANGLRFGYLSQGEGPLVICIHGFPDTAYTYRDLMQRLSDRGYRVVAPFSRGYAPTGIPDDNGFAAEDLGRDVVALIDEFDASEAYLIGHDWGAIAVYAAIALAPEKVIKAVTAAVPHPNAIKFTAAQLRKSWYIFFFQLPWLAERKIRQDNYALIEKLWRDWSPGLAEADAAFYVNAFKQALSEDEHVVAALAYYRALIKPKNIKRVTELFAEPISVPTLTLAGENDGCIGPEHFPGMHSFFSGQFNLEILAGAGHFMHLEQPEVFANHVLNFFD
ncbi:MAG: alpha/beta hydrolase [Pseudomonadota bacterium]